MDVGQVKQLSNGLNGGKRSFVLDNFTELAIVAFDGVGGVNHAPDFTWKVKKSREFFPVVFPGPDGTGILAAPQLIQFE